ncbi:MAG: lamin tail domain-containing protein [Bacteroidota bacterium]
MKYQVTYIVCVIASVLFLQPSVHAQLLENFSDGDFTTDPTWLGNTSDFVVNAPGQLQSNNTLTNSSFYLSTANTLATNVQWEFFINLPFSTSGANYADIYLTASQSDLSATNNSGYFVRVGNTEDEISLYRKDANGNSIKIIDGVNETIATGNNAVKIKVIRDANNHWILMHDITGTGNNYKSETTTVDVTYTSTAFFGILIKQSTASFFQKHFLDDIKIIGYVPDITAPSIVSVFPTTEKTIAIIFNEPVSDFSANNTDNYSIPNIGKPTEALIDVSNSKQVLVSFSTAFISGVSYTIKVNGVKDLAGNAINTTYPFTYFIPTEYDIVIDEIMADPSPSVGLPNAEWIELKNTSAYDINLKDYRIGNTSNTSLPLPAYLLQAGTFVIVTANLNVAALTAFGSTIGITNFPSLGNDEDEVFLQNNTGAIMHQVSYNKSWYQNPVKADGGWSLEMIDTYNPCGSGTNWKSSTNITGGTPGKKNAVESSNADKTGPFLLRAYANDSLSIILYFDETLDSTKAAITTCYTINEGIGMPVTAIPQLTGFNKVNLVLQSPLLPGKIYTISVKNLSDCSGNILENSIVKVGLAVIADSLDIIINEILFDPQPFGADYLELYNRSDKIIDLFDIAVAGKTSGSLPGTPIKVSNDHHLFFPKEFIAVTTDPAVVKQQYVVKDETAFSSSKLPAFSNDKGTALLLNNHGDVLDILDYNSNWHFALLDNKQGISLERINYNKPTNQPSNWTSAASTVGFGTPGYQNSQFRSDLELQGSITIHPKIFSPDNDGFEDFALIEFAFAEPGYVANITIFDAAGRPVKVLQRNTTTTAKGNFRWDGLDDKQQKIPAGTYIIYTDIFNLDGRKKQFKNAVVLARKF